MSDLVLGAFVAFIILAGLYEAGVFILRERKADK